MADTAARLEAFKAAASVRDTNFTAARPIDTCIEELALTFIAELPFTIANRYHKG